MSPENELGGREIAVFAIPDQGLAIGPVCETLWVREARTNLAKRGEFVDYSALPKGDRLLGQKHTHQTVIRERYIDWFGHMNHAIYLQLFEEARWEWVTRNGYGMEKMMSSGQGPVVVDVHIRYKREIKVRDLVTIESVCTGFKKRLAIISQSMINEAGQVCCTAEVTLVLFDKTTRQMIAPTPQFLCAIGLEEAVKLLDSGVEKIDSNLIF